MNIPTTLEVNKIYINSKEPHLLIIGEIPKLNQLISFGKMLTPILQTVSWDPHQPIQFLLPHLIILILM